MYARASGTARVFPRTYALGLAWLKYTGALRASTLLNAARFKSNGSNAMPRRSKAANSGFCHSGCSKSTTRSRSRAMVMAVSAPHAYLACIVGASEEASRLMRPQRGVQAAPREQHLV